MEDANYSMEVPIIDVSENSTGLIFPPEIFVSRREDSPVWIKATNGVVSTVSLLSQAIVILIAKGLEGDYSAKTLMWVQAICETSKRLFNTILTFQNQIREQQQI